MLHAPSLCEERPKPFNFLMVQHFGKGVSNQAFWGEDLPAIPGDSMKHKFLTCFV